MEKLDLLARESINIVEEEYDRARLDKNESEDWVFILETLLKYIDEEDEDTPLGVWTSIVTMITAEYNAYKDNEEIMDKIESLDSKLIKLATSLGF
jgi:hypothetical protein